MKLKAQGEDEGQDELDDCLAIGKKLRVGGLIVDIDGDRAILSGRCGGPGHVSSPCGWQSVWMRHGVGNILKDQAYCEKIGALPHNSVACKVIRSTAESDRARFSGRTIKSLSIAFAETEE